MLNDEIFSLVPFSYNVYNFFRDTLKQAFEKRRKLKSTTLKRNAAHFEKNVVLKKSVLKRRGLC